MSNQLFSVWRPAVSVAAVVVGLSACGGNPAVAHDDSALRNINTLVVIYAENRGFDNLYGLFPGANGIPGVNSSARGNVNPQVDVDGAVLPVLPPTWGGATVPGQSKVVTQAQSAGLPNKPFRIESTEGLGLDSSIITRDLVHRFYNNQMQIHGGKNDQFATYSDAGGLSLGYYDGSNMAMWKLAQQYTLADNFFMGAFGGSFLNHQYLICACAPQYPHADQSPAKGGISRIDVDANGQFVRLTPAVGSPKSTLDGPQKYINDGTLTPADAKGMFYAVNTMQPAYQPSNVAPAVTDGSHLFADANNASTLPPLTQTNIGDLLTAKGVSWAWYAGAWNETSATASGSRKFGVPMPNFQFHHQPFNYYANMDPVTHAAYRAEHLKDFDSSFLQDAAAGKLPAVSFYKPQGNLNQHSGYADVASGDAHIADVINKLRQSPQWSHMLIVVTYDENGGFWDHAAPPKMDQWGPGTRIPAIIISPYAKKGYVDSSLYDTSSILRFITRRWSLPTLDGIALRDKAIAAQGGQPLGDLSNALVAQPQ
ncbi:acid phosphatase [Herbaspirillum sp. Sphag1AN]|uniref:acid phosphatase n=1 Tax=unclassified Herbaspirillum TaxID=2624150 RepID=UPI001614389F|nr:MULTISPECIES: acid phosphatase [unclassified Herbaspirillum]MBB3212260.1 acid phosphatase [Herbaspirillum sp. Sphag1AN]MBB3245642.1 acid phosphatase [Herbaspirillum sp. Sphag64]